MIAGVFLRGYKTYKSTKFVPVSTGHRFAAFVGPNGAGKSSVLEALNTYFNDTEWIVNKIARQEGHLTNFINLPFICPVFVIEKKALAVAHAELSQTTSMEIIEKISAYLWQVEQKDVTSFKEFASFENLRAGLADAFSRDDYYLLVAGKRTNSDKELAQTHFGPFHAQPSFLSAVGIMPSENEKQLDRSKENDASIRNNVGDLNSIMRHLYDYIHIPSDVIISDFTKLETGTMQLLMGRSIDDEIRKAITLTTLNQINRSLEETVQAAVKGLAGYSYDKPKGGRKNITIPALSKLITKEFFSIRELSLDDGTGQPTPVSNLSSGEQRRALVDVASNYLRSGASNHQRTIFAIDEPEISLHTSRCFDQFELLFDVARKGVQTLITTHWYGFLPIAQEGTAHFLERDEKGVTVESYDLSDYREKAIKAQRNSRGEIPFDVSLKSTNDLVQSIASSLRLPEPYSWILCEGSSERVYFAHMLKSEIAAGRLRILPLGGAGEVHKIFRFLHMAMSDRASNTAGRVVALIDTDEHEVQHVAIKDTSILKFRRLLLPSGGKLSLVPVSSNHVSPATSIEDALNPGCFVETLRTFGADVGFQIPPAARDGASASGSALDLKQSEHEQLHAFFGVAGRKVEFARRYVETAAETALQEPLGELIRTILKE